MEDFDAFEKLENEIWVLRFRDLGASCFGLRFQVLRFRNYPFAIYRRNTYEQYGGYKFFQNAEFKANFSIKV